jgi:HD-GYP domain-containing protein (c-di-GMP phosphodiesterase class II)
MREPVRRVTTILRVVVPYLFFASIWILVSDEVAQWMSGGDPDLLTHLQNYKGIAFVLASSLLIYILLLNELRRKAIADQLHQAEVQNYLVQVEKHAADLESSQEATIRSFALALELRDLETSGHAERTSRMIERLVDLFHIPEENRRSIRWGALLHDIGKVGIPDAILLKPGSLTPDEREIMQRHCAYGRDFLDKIPYLQTTLVIPYCHHERWDGSGYPCGLKSTDIPLEARLFAVVDVADAMTSDRPYRKALSIQATYDHLTQEAGRLYDPEVVKRFIDEDLIRFVRS